MVVIRLSRQGAKKRPFYHINVADKRSPRDGSYLERVGYYEPRPGEKINLHINEERVQYWISKGAQLSDRVARLRKDYARLLKDMPPKKEVVEEQLAL